MKEIKYKTIKNIGTISYKNGRTKKLNVISWNEEERKLKKILSIPNKL